MEERDRAAGRRRGRVAAGEDRQVGEARSRYYRENLVWSVLASKNKNRIVIEEV